ncbi:MAG: hypothetical protein ACLQGP_23280 [Isosphaeraceae bacterium]
MSPVLRASTARASPRPPTISSVAGSSPRGFSRARSDSERVKGIGRKRLEKVRPLVTID